MENHGRNVIELANTSRSVGWFTNRYPILLSILGEDLQTQIISLKEQIREGVKRGPEYSALKFIHGEELPAIKGICFNYLGEYANRQNEYFKLKQLFFDSNQSGTNHIPYLIDINAIVLNRCCHILIRFDRNELERNYIDTFTHNFENKISKILEHCSRSDEIMYTPTDFDLAGLTQDELDHLF